MGLYEFLQSAYRSGLAGISRIAGSPFRYYRDGLFTIHNADFMQDQSFVRAYQLGVRTAGFDPHIEWRVYVCCWAAKYALSREGDFVECGVNTGFTTRAVIDYASFDKTSRRFYLLDTFEGMPADQFTPDEVKIGLRDRFARSYTNVYDSVRQTFASFPNVVLVKGRIPETLAQVPATKVAYLSIDLNAVVPEIAAAEDFWERMVSGGIIVLDDYGWTHHIAQKHAFDAFASQRGVMVLSLPTGQGVILKP